MNRALVKFAPLIVLLITLSSFFAVGASLSSESISVGSNVTVSWTGLTASTTYYIKNDVGDVLERFTTGGSETTHTSSLIVSKSGTNTFYLYNSSDVLQYTLEVLGVDPFDSLVYSIVPIIIAAAVVMAIMGLTRKLS